MKNNKIIYLVVTIMALVLGTVHFFVDSKLFYYGESRYNICRKSLPLELYPDFWDTHVSFPMIGFTIRDKYGLTAIAKESSYEYKGSFIEVKEIIKYGFNKDRLIAFIENVKGDHYYIEFSSYTDIKSVKNLRITVLGQEPKINLDDYNWIDVKRDENRISDLKLIREYSILIFVVLTLIIFLGTVILRKARIV